MSETEELTYEVALGRLDEQLRILESSDVSLEQALEAVAAAHRYLKVCNDKLDEARRRIEVRPETGGTA